MKKQNLLWIFVIFLLTQTLLAPPPKKGGGARKQSYKARIAITGLYADGFGDYAKRVKTLNLLKEAGYQAKIIAGSPKEYLERFKVAKSDLLISDEDLMGFLPDLLVSTPSTMNIAQSRFQVVFERPVIGVQEYGNGSGEDSFVADPKNRPLVSVHLSGMKGLGLLLRRDYRKRFKNPKQHLKLLPKIYQEAIYYGSFRDFDRRNDFYFGYAEEHDSFMAFLKAITKDHAETVRKGKPKDLTFYFMGDKWKKKLTADDKREILDDAQISEIRLTHITNGQSVQSQVVRLTGKATDFKVHVVSGRINNKYVMSLWSAAKETLSTGDASMAEVYSAGKVPLLYETLTHKQSFRRDQMTLICGAILERNPGLKSTCDSLKKPVLHLPSRFEKLLDLKNEKGVQQALQNHLRYVQQELDFEKNFLTLVNSAAKAFVPRRSELPKIITDPNEWPLNKKFITHHKKLKALGVDGDKIKLNSTNRKFYDKWKDYYFVTNNFMDYESVVIADAATKERLKQEKERRRVSYQATKGLIEAFTEGFSGPSVSGVQAELDKGAYVDVIVLRRFQMTGLHYATRKGNKDIVALLLKYGANKQIKDKSDKTALDWAKEEGKTEIIQLLK